MTGHLAGTPTSGERRLCCSFVPPYLLRRLADDDRSMLPADVGHQTLRLDQAIRQRREEKSPASATAGATTEVPPTRRLVHDAHQEIALPGELVRSEGQAATGDIAVDEAYDWGGEVIALFAEEFARGSFDGKGADVLITVHYAKDYDNAFWDGDQLVFGDGDGVIFERFTKPIEVMAHEFTHAVTQYTTGLRYEGQSGALNESISDVFATLTRQRALGQQVGEADWLIGVGLFRPPVQAKALRSMLHPGTAYDDPQLGKDPQVGSMADYVETLDDYGGVHINSGIPNRAFALAATGLGGYSWERVGLVWYEALTSGDVKRSTDFAGFARATVAAAERRFLDDPAVAEQVRAAWVTVGVLGERDAEVLVPHHPSSGDESLAPGPGAEQPQPVQSPPTLPQPESAGTGGSGPRSEPAASPTSPEAATVVAVQRRGGFAGLVREGRLDLQNDPHAEEVRDLLRHVDLHSISPTEPKPDRFIYTVEFGHVRVNVGEQDLTPELNRVVQIVLGSESHLDLK
jgi:Thermolysin metallopeptidase, alpha-helical domain/Thermolysin metallopeptidase, catalytic domain